jgi:hypothetical protein
MNLHTRNIEDVKDGEVLKDGQSIRVGFSMMDSVADPAALAALHSMRDAKPQVMHRPGQIAMTDAARILRDSARIDRVERIERINNAWRNPAPLVDNKVTQQSDAKPDPMTAYQARSARLRDAWKGDQR